MLQLYLKITSYRFECFRNSKLFGFLAASNAVVSVGKLNSNWWSNLLKHNYIINKYIESVNITTAYTLSCRRLGDLRYKSFRLIAVVTHSLSHFFNGVVLGAMLKNHRTRRRRRAAGRCRSPLCHRNAARRGTFCRRRLPPVVVGCHRSPPVTTGRHRSPFASAAAALSAAVGCQRSPSFAASRCCGAIAAEQQNLLVSLK